jgi:hypothetical protein
MRRDLHILGPLIFISSGTATLRTSGPPKIQGVVGLTQAIPDLTLRAAKWPFNFAIPQNYMLFRFILGLRHIGLGALEIRKTEPYLFFRKIKNGGEEDVENLGSIERNGSIRP